MNEFFTTQMIETLLTDLEADLIETEKIDDNIDGFSPNLWLESPERNYLSAIEGIYELGQSDVISYMLKKMYSILNGFEKEDASPVSKKMILIICELILQGKRINQSDDVVEPLSKLVSYQLENEIKKDIMIKKIRDVIRLGVVNGINPVPRAKLNFVSGNDIIKGLKILRSMRQARTTS